MASQNANGPLSEIGRTGSGGGWKMTGVGIYLRGNGSGGDWVLTWICVYFTRSRSGI